MKIDRKQKAIFLDRDGTIMKDVGYLDNTDQVVLLPGAGEALKCLADAGFLLVLITNQSGIGRAFHQYCLLRLFRRFRA